MTAAAASLGLAGCGEIARRHARELAANPAIGLRLTTVTDIDSVAGAAFAAEHGIRYVPTLDELLASDVDLVCICTPNATHASIALEALGAEKHVLVEHPLAMASDDATRLIDAAKLANRQLFVVRQRRFSRAVQLLRAAMRANLLGAIYNVELRLHWNRRTSYFDEKPWRGRGENGGVVANQASHFLDLLLYLFGDPIHATGIFGNVRHAIACEDTCQGTLLFPDEVRATIECTTAAPEGCNETSLVIRGERATVALTGRDLDRLAEPLPASFHALAIDESAPLTGDHRGYLERVARRLAGEAIEVVDGREGARTVELIETIYASFHRDDELLRARFAEVFGGTAA